MVLAHCFLARLFDCPCCISLSSSPVATELIELFAAYSAPQTLEKGSVGKEVDYYYYHCSLAGVLAVVPAASSFLDSSSLFSATLKPHD